MVKTVLENVRDVIAAGSMVIDSARSEILWLLPPQMLTYGRQFGLTEKSKVFVEKGGRVRGITQIFKVDVPVVRVLLDIGEDVRHVDEYRGEFMLVADKEISVSSIPQHANYLEDLSLDDRVIWFWTDNPAYAEYLVTNFESSWKEAIDAKQRIQELGV